MGLHSNFVLTCLFSCFGFDVHALVGLCLCTRILCFIICFSLVPSLFVDLMCALILTILLTGTDKHKINKSNLKYTKEFSFIV